MDFRLVAAFLTVASLWSHRFHDDVLLLALMVAALASYVPLRRWDRLEPALLRHPVFMAADALLALGILAFVGPANPFFFYTLGTAALAGVLYRGAGTLLFSAILVGGYALIMDQWLTLQAGASSFQMKIGQPSLYVLVALGGWALRRLLDTQAATTASLQTTTRLAAAADERARLAREMHDSVAKSLCGIALSASALATWIERSPDAAISRARDLARAAETAAAEARALIGSLRADRVDEPFAAAVARAGSSWSEAAGTAVALDVEDVEVNSPAVRYELLCILREALNNVERHAGASRVVVRLVGQGDMAILEVTDDGEGFGSGIDLPALSAAGYYGLVGMAERVREAGGTLEITTEPGRGTTVRVTVPRTFAEDFSAIHGRR